MINYNKLNPFKRLFYGIAARTRRVNDKFRFTKMRSLNSLIDQQSSTYNKNVSYRMKWFDFQHQKFLSEWDIVTDQIFGGSSSANLWFDKQNKSASFQGYVETKDKDRMVFYPFINFMRSHPVFVKLGPMRLFQVQAKTDGKPLQVHFTLKSLLKGEVNVYGFILSKSTDWHTYQIPLENLILRGTQQDYHQGTLFIKKGISMAGRSGDYFSKANQTSIFKKDDESVKKIIETEIFNEDSIQLSNVGFRLVSTQSQKRNIKIKNINFAYKKGFEKFVDDYKNPYFYKTDDEVTQQNNDSKTRRCQIQFLKNNLQNINTIDTGDLVYKRNIKKNRK